MGGCAFRPARYGAPMKRTADARRRASPRLGCAATLAFGLGACRGAETPPAAEPPVAVDAGALDASPDVDTGDADAAAPLCPPGFHLVRDARRCDPAAPTPPALAAALATAPPGDVVSLGGLATPSLPCAPVRVCAPDAARTLVFSDDPEDPAVSGVLYAETLRKGTPYRIYVYHANGGTTPRKFSVVALNQGAGAASLRIERSAVARPGADYLGIGKDVARRYFAAPTPRTVSVPAGARVMVDPELDAATAQRLELVHAMYDVTPDADLKLSVVTVAPSVDAAAATASLPLLPFDGKHARGTFPDADLALFVEVPGPSKVARLRLGADSVDPHLAGRDATTGSAISLVGNFGAIYTLYLPAGTLTAVAPRGGAWAGACERATTVTALPRAASFIDADAVRLPAAGADAPLRLMTAGSSSLPVDLLVTSGQ